MAKSGSTTPRKTTRRAVATTAAPGTVTKARQTSVTPTEEQIRMRAYEIFQRRNGAPGDPFNDWVQAQQELTRELSA